MSKPMTVFVFPLAGERVCLEQYPDLSGWMLFKPANGRIGCVIASADTRAELEKFATRLKLNVTVF